ncbi:hypothetical protein EWH99_06410 [Sporolactobacillus sp. THM7-7]|nr:hypothetical protein EWH99_06410 [Sporolactobacillus sp. THM7-7]
MKARIIAVLLCLVFFILPLEHGHAKNVHQNGRIEALVELSDRIFQYADTNRLNAAKSLLDEFNQQWSKQKADFSETEVRVVDSAALQLKLLLDSNVNHSESRNAAITLRLCMDALATDDDPLWKKMRSRVTDPVAAMKKALESKNRAAFQSEMNRFLDGYALIYPSLVLDVRPDSLRLLDEVVSDISQRRVWIGREKERIRQLNRLDRELSIVFRQSPASYEDRLLIFVTAVGGFVLTVLFYVSWRKYLGERRKKAERP